MKSQQSSPDLHPPYSGWFAPRNKGDRSNNLHRLTIGFLGLFLPIVLLVMNKVRPTEELVENGVLLDSVSAYYYTGAVAAYIGIIFALAVALFIYEGYGKKFNFNRIVGVVASLAAICVAFFPTHAPEGLTAPSWWTRETGAIHYVSAVVLFICFIIFSVLLFTRSKIEEGELPPGGKKLRNAFYYTCGFVMAISVLWAWKTRTSSPEASIFIPEATAMTFFALSWLAKGRLDWFVRSTKERTVYFWHNPGELVDKSLESIGDLRK